MWFRQCWGCRLAATGLINDPQRRREQKKGKRDFGSWEICEVPWHGSVVPVVAIHELSTQEARRVLPAQVSRADVSIRRIWVAAARVGNRRVTGSERRCKTDCISLIVKL